MNDGDAKPEEIQSNVGGQDPTSVNLKLKIPGFPGEPYSVVLANIYRAPDSHLNQIPPSGVPGLYQVTFVLGKPGTRSFPENEIKFAQFMNGDSHLAIVRPAFPAPEDAVKVRFEVHEANERFVFDGVPNQQGFLAKLESQPFHALNRNDAEMRATRVAQSMLSEYAANLDIPICFELIEVTELKTQNKSLSLVSPFVSAGSSAPIKTYDAEFSVVAGLYREGLNSNTPAYRFLCFYKILEFSRKRRERLGRKLKKKLQPLRDGELIPSLPQEQVSWLNSIFYTKREWDELTLRQIFPQEVHGKKLTALFDTKLRPIRDRIAHGILDSGQYLHLDDLSSIRDISKWLPFLRCAVRRVLKNDFPDRYLSYLSEDGSIKQ